MTEFLMPFCQSCIQESLAPVMFLPIITRFCPLTHGEVLSVTQHPYQSNAAPAVKREAAAGRTQSRSLS